jgi:hypothetical protein
MNGQITTFANLFERFGRRHRIDWDQLFDRFSKPVETAKKETLTLWAPATFRNNSRMASDVELVYALVLDFDHGGTIERAVSAFAQFHGLLHTTHRHAAAEPRFRVVLPCATPLGAWDYPALWVAADRFCRMHALCPDASCKNASRVWYVPGRRPGAFFEVRRLRGTTLDAEAFRALWAKPLARASRNSRCSFEPRLADRDRRLQRASAYLTRLPASVSGQRGHDALWRAALALVCGFALEPSEAFAMLKREFSPRCQPPWCERDLAHKVRDAAKARVPIGYLASADARVGCP